MVALMLSIEAQEGLDEINQFNATSAEYQLQMGVNPDECLKIVPSLIDKRTDLDVLFDGLKRAEWTSPVVGEWLRHDRIHHWPGVRNMNPVFVPAIMFAASIGEQQLLHGNKREAALTGDFIDFVVNLVPSESSYDILLRKCGVSLEIVDSRFSYKALSTYRESIRELQRHDNSHD